MAMEILHAVEKKIGKSFRNEQVNALLSLMKGTDTFVQLPTGFGKSLIFQCLPFIYRERGTDNPVILVICPLLSLLQAHSLTIETYGFEPCILGHGGIIKGKHYDFILASPEALLRETWRDFIRTVNIMCIVADEVHTIPKW
jgi:superfamily II DNA helicase RecQ